MLIGRDTVCQNQVYQWDQNRTLQNTHLRGHYPMDLLLGPRAKNIKDRTATPGSKISYPRLFNAWANLYAVDSTVLQCLAGPLT